MLPEGDPEVTLCQFEAYPGSGSHFDIYVYGKWIGSAHQNLVEERINNYINRDFQY